MPDTIIVVPCFNEAERLPVEKFRHFVQLAPNIRFLFVDDGSTDETRSLLQSLKNPDTGAFDIHALPQNRGKAEAVRQGLLKASESNPAYLGFWDADLSTPLDAIPAFCDILDGRPEIEMVFGARVRLLGRAIERSLFRHYAGRIFATVVSRMLHLPIYDTQCGAKLFRASPGLIDLFREPFVSRWIFDVEILARLIRARSLSVVQGIIYEYPLLKWRDIEGSKIGPHDFWKVLAELIRVYRRYWKRRP